jgi:Flp pilus assembly protein TadG
MPLAPGMLWVFGRDARGNFGVIAGLVALVLAAALGGATDLSMQYKAVSRLQDAVDAAALAGAKKLEQDIAATPDAEVSRMIKVNGPAGLSGLTIATRVDPVGRTVTVRASGQIRPSFLPLLRINTLDVEASASSSIQKEQHTDFYFLLDVSESMNLAASDADRDALEYWTNIERKGEPCAFACHTGDSARPKPAYQVARDHGVRLRIDVLQSAADKMIDRILAENAVPGTLTFNRVATAGFSWNFAKGSAPSTDAAGLKSSIRSFSVANDHTRFWWAFSNFSSMLGLQGTGDTAILPKKVAILVTDGVRDEGFGSGQLGPLDPNFCAAIKAKGIDLAVLEIKYVARPKEYFFQQRVASYYASISPSLKSCASSGLYFLATDADEASAGLLKLTDAVLSQRHLVD